MTSRTTVSARPPAEPAPNPSARAGRTRRRSKSAASDSPAGEVPQCLSDDQRRRYVAEAAYFIAERRRFVGGSPDDDWLAAEVEIDRLFAPPRH